MIWHDHDILAGWEEVNHGTAQLVRLSTDGFITNIIRRRTKDIREGGRKNQP